MLGVLSLPCISQWGLCHSWDVAGLRLPMTNTAPGPTAGSSAAGGGSGKAGLELECGPGYHLYPPLPVLKALPEASRVILRHSYSLCLYGRVEGAHSDSQLLPQPAPSLQSSAGAAVGGRAAAGQLLRTIGAPSSFINSPQPARLAPWHRVGIFFPVTVQGFLCPLPFALLM